MPDEPEREAVWVIDRFEGDLAVVDGGDGRMLDLPRRLLPAEAAEGDWLNVSCEANGAEGTLIRVTIDRSATRRARAEAEQRLLRLGRDDYRGDLEL